MQWGLWGGILCSRLAHYENVETSKADLNRLLEALGDEW
jgi:hypothetical protein